MTRAWVDGERGVEVVDVRLCGILEHGGGPVRDAGQPAVEVRQPVVELGQAVLELGRGLPLNALDLLLEARDLRLQLGGVRLERLEILLQLRAQRAPLHLGEVCAHRLDLGLSRGQALLEVLRGLLHDALDLGDRRRVHPQAGGQVGYRRCPYSSVTSPPVVET